MAGAAADGRRPTSVLTGGVGCCRRSCGCRSTRAFRRTSANSLASVAVETGAHAVVLCRRLDLAAPFSGDSLLLVTYYAFWAVPVVAACALIRTLVVSPRLGDSARSERALVAGLLAMGVLANMSFLRANLAERFGDAISAARPAGRLDRRRRVGRGQSPIARRSAIDAVRSLLVVQMLGRRLRISRTSRASSTPADCPIRGGRSTRRYRDRPDDLSGLPPDDVARDMVQSAAMQAAGYIARCTAP